MKYTIIFSFIFYFYSHINYSQSVIGVNGSLGYYFYHSDNSLPITQNSDFNNLSGINISFKQSLNESFSLSIETGLSTSSVLRAITETYYEDKRYSDMKINILQRSIPIDISLSRKISRMFELGIGISLEGISRELKLDHRYFSEYFNDKINIISVGGNSHFGFIYFIPQINNLVFEMKIKLRYIFAVSILADDRKLDDYSHNQFQGNLTFGIGYAF